MELYYINSRNEKLDFCKPPYIIRDIDEILDYAWDYENSDDVIVAFTRGICEIPFKINVIHSDETTYQSACEHFFEVTEYDVLTDQKGKLYFGKQYILCNLIQSKKIDWNKGISFRILAATVVTDFPFWITEERTDYRKSSSPESSSIFLDYPFDYPFDYLGDVSGVGVIFNSSIVPVHFRMIIYGGCLNPRITVDGHLYEFTVALDEGEYLVVDSRERSIIRVKTDGRQINEFDCRNTDSSVFEHIPPGSSYVSWDGTFGFEIRLFRERSEPEWT